jgi:hypothetical protein
MARFALIASILGFAFWIMEPALCRTQEATSSDQDQVQQEGVQVEARGPVHEAFAEPPIRGPRATPIVPKEPPAPIEELPPDQKPEGDNVVWIPGYWAWDADRNDFLWVSGTYRAVPPGRSWVPGRWNQVEGGWQWVAGYWAEETTQDQAAQDQTAQSGNEVDYLPPPPDPVAESQPPAPSQTDVYVPGTWVYRDTRYMWRPGFYVPYRAGWVWIPAHYIWTPAGYVFVEGYWDYALGDRGLLFAPVYLRAGLYGRPGWSYQPSYTVPVPFLMGCLFVRADTCHYFFGDYFEANYQRAGYVSWIDFRVGQRYYDPLFEYYRFAHRDNPGWYRDLREVYIGRQEGRLARPPRNLLQQTTLIRDNRITTINNISVNNITNINSITNVAPLASLRQMQSARIVKLQPLSRTQIQAERQSARDYRNVIAARAKVEQQVVSRGSPLRAGAQAAPVRVSLPVPAALRRPSRAVQAPPRPTGLGRMEAGHAQEPGRPVAPGRVEQPRVQPEHGRPVTPAPNQPPSEMRREIQPPATERRPTVPAERPSTRPSVPPVERPPAATERRTEPAPVERRPATQPPAFERRGEPPPAERRPAAPPPSTERPAERPQIERRPPTPLPAERQVPTPPAAERRPPAPPAAERQLPTPPPVERRPPTSPPAERRPPTPPAAERQPPTPPPAERRPPTPPPAERRPPLPPPAAERRAAPPPERRPPPAEKKPPEKPKDKPPER